MFLQVGYALEYIRLRLGLVYEDKLQIRVQLFHVYWTESLYLLSLEAFNQGWPKMGIAPVRACPWSGIFGILSSINALFQSF